jgi:hypothetical protein
MIAAEGLAAIGVGIASIGRGDGAATDYEIAWVTVVLRDLRVRAQRLGLDGSRAPAAADRCGPAGAAGHGAAPTSLLALANSRQTQVMARRDTYYLSAR